MKYMTYITSGKIENTNMDNVKEMTNIMYIPRGGRREGVHDGCHLKQPQGAGTMGAPS
jgi:hypothetical protein